MIYWEVVLKIGLQNIKLKENQKIEKCQDIAHELENTSGVAS